MDSGIAESRLTLVDISYFNFTFVAENVGCDGLKGDSAKELDCMCGVNVVKIKDFLASYIEGGRFSSLGFNLVPDKNVVFSNYT
jgi:hypothetical protein